MTARHDDTWTAPYYGVSHRYVFGRQCMVEDYGPFTVATVFGPLGHVWRGAREADETFASIDEARQWCEQVAGLTE